MNKPKLIILCLLLLAAVSCRKDIVIKNTPENVFLTFWKIMDENYVYFEEKGVDWDSIFNVYYPQAKEAKTNKDLFRIFSEIISLFKDGHLYIRGCVNDSNFTIAPYFLTDTLSLLYNPEYAFENSGFVNKNISKNFNCYQYNGKSYALISIYSIGNDSRYYITTASELNSSLKYLDYKDGLIFDIMLNGGGWSDEMKNIASLFYKGNKILYYWQGKIGKGHNDFGSKIPQYFEGQGIVSENIPIVVLTGPNTYSAGNIFAYIMKGLPNCMLIGKRTGGGGGARHEVILPNGWILGYPFKKSFSTKDENMEYALMPDIYVKDENSGQDVTSQWYVVKRAVEFLDSINEY